MSNTSKQVATVGMVAGLLVSAVLVPRMAWADTQDLEFSFNFSHISGPEPAISLSAYTDSTENQVGAGENGNGLMAIVGGEDNRFPIEIMDGYFNRIDTARVTTSCASTESCTVRVAGVDTTGESAGVRFVFGGNQYGSAPLGMYYLDNQPEDVEYLGTQTMLTTNEGLVIKYAEPAQFNGNAYAIWGCGTSNSVCMHLITNIPVEEGTTNYYDASTITSDVNDTTSTFNAFGGYENEYRRGMALEGAVEKWVKQTYGNEATVNNVDWSSVNVSNFLYGSENVAGVKLQPVGEPTGAHSYTSYGDRNFRLTIYDEQYRAVKPNFSDLYYIPDYYDSNVFAEAYEISGTDRERPMTMETFLLENTVKIEPLVLGGLEITSITPLDVPAGAVSVSADDGIYTLKFNSNYYDDVTFEITDSAGERYYLRVCRSALSPELDYRSMLVRATFLFDSNTNYSDYELIATYVYRDGRKVQKPMTNEGKIDDGLGNITFGPEAEAGLHLKRASYVVEEDSDDFLNDLVGVYFNVRRAGSSDTNYAGTLTGSGYGVLMDIVVGRG